MPGVVSNFDEDAALYDAIRPQYPVELISAIADYAGITTTSRILEIGSGSGQATAMLLAYRCAIDCVEPGQNLSRIAKEKFKSMPNIRIFNDKFEDWKSDVTFDVVLSATAFHWIPADIAYSKSAKCLKPQGTIALFWNMHPKLTKHSTEVVEDIIRQEDPDLLCTFHAPSDDEVLQEGLQELRETELFDDVVSLRFPWKQAYSSRGFTDLLSTYANFRSLSPNKRSSIMSRIERDLGEETLVLDYLAALHLGRRK